MRNAIATATVQAGCGPACGVFQNNGHVEAPLPTQCTDASDFAFAADAGMLQTTSNRVGGCLNHRPCWTPCFESF